jgi:hypothetical protein
MKVGIALSKQTAAEPSGGRNRADNRPMGLASICRPGSTQRSHLARREAMPISLQLRRWAVRLFARPSALTVLALDP